MAILLSAGKSDSQSCSRSSSVAPLYAFSFAVRLGSSSSLITTSFHLFSGASQASMRLVEFEDQRRCDDAGLDLCRAGDAYLATGRARGVVNPRIHRGLPGLPRLPARQWIVQLR